ncbi:MAG: DUF3054 domain-containing protein [Nostocoides sp.]
MSGQSTGGDAVTATAPGRRPWANSVDAVLIIVFAAIGRASHGEQLDLHGIVLTAYPFIVGALLGWLVLRARGEDLRGGMGIWAFTLVGGLVIRGLTGQGVAVSFGIVAGAVLAVFLLGWRAIADRWAAARRS